MAVAASFSLRPTSPASERSTLTFNVGCWKACWIRASAIPGICLIRANRALAYFLSACRSLPTTCRSIGAGTPKFRIWLTMSAGKNAKEVPGNWRGSCSRIVLT
jgi:hypothetical protein